MLEKSCNQYCRSQKYPDALAQDELLYTVLSVAVSDIPACKQSAMES